MKIRLGNANMLFYPTYSTQTKQKNTKEKRKQQPKATGTKTEWGWGEERQGRRYKQEAGIQNRITNSKQSNSISKVILCKLETKNCS